MNLGFTANGVSRWRYFGTIEAASLAASEHEKRTGVVVAVEAAPSSSDCDCAPVYVHRCRHGIMG